MLPFFATLPIRLKMRSFTCLYTPSVWGLVAMVMAVVFAPPAAAQSPTIAQEWNEAVLVSITRDFARPTVHARNLFHTSIAMYDAWAAYDPSAEPYLLGRTRGSYTSPFNGVVIPSSPEAIEDARAEAISFAAYRLILHRFQNSPSAFIIFNNVNQKMDGLGYNRFNTSTDYVNGGAAELGNFIAQQLINFGFTDGSNESADYANQFYEPLNGNILPEQPGPGEVIDPNRWQAISLTVQIDQSGNAVSDPPHLSAEWGNVLPFSMNADNRVTLERDGHQWQVYYDPGAPPYLDVNDPSGLESLYKWGHLMVSVWQSHLDPDDETVWDISPGSIGNVPNLPATFEEHLSFYNFFDGGTPAAELGYDVNPSTGEPYEPQLVKRADYARILAEFWADGLDSETPPGHWFKIFNEIRHHPEWEDRWMGEGELLGRLEYDVKFYLTLGGAMHDAAISAWSIKGYYDYARPVTAIRYMCEMGQCSDPMQPNYHPAGVPLIPGYIELVELGDPLAGDDNEHVGKVKLYTWRGPDYIPDPETTYSGVGWILGENWWPYQRPSFVTPPFSGYISGHSTFSRTAAEVFTLLTGTPYFPGGMSNFVAEENEFLEFEVGPSETVILQWATYQDASDQCSLSRIWGGIHPPADDIPGRLIGIELGPQVVAHANEILFTDRPVVESVEVSNAVINIDAIGTSFTTTITFDRQMNVNAVPAISFVNQDPLLLNVLEVVDVGWINSTQYQITYEVPQSEVELYNIFLRVAQAQAVDGTPQNVYLSGQPFVIDTRRPEFNAFATTVAIVNDEVAQTGSFEVALYFSEPCDTELTPVIGLSSPEAIDESVSVLVGDGYWFDQHEYRVVISAADANVEVDEVGIEISAVRDAYGNEIEFVEVNQVFTIDTRNPDVLLAEISTDLLNVASVGSNALTFTVSFDEAMNTSAEVSIQFPADNPLGTVLTVNNFTTGWQDNQTFTASFNQQASSVALDMLTLQLVGFTDEAGNEPVVETFENLFTIDTQRPEVSEVTPSTFVVSDDDVADGSFSVDVMFEEPMNQDQLLLIQLQGSPDISASLVYNPINSSWITDDLFRAVFNANDQNVEIGPIALNVSFGIDLAGNAQIPFTLDEWIHIDTRNPEIVTLLANTYNVTPSSIGEAGFAVLVLFDEPMEQVEVPELVFFADGDLEEVLSFNPAFSGWLNEFTYQVFWDVANVDYTESNIGIGVTNVNDLAGNTLLSSQFDAFFNIDLSTVGLNEERSFDGLTAFPNPLQTGNDLLVSTSKTLGPTTVELYGLDGRKVYQMEQTVVNGGILRIPTYDLAAGLYVLTLYTDSERYSSKIVVTD